MQRIQPIKTNINNTEYTSRSYLFMKKKAVSQNRKQNDKDSHLYIERKKCTSNLAR